MWRTIWAWDLTKKGPVLAVGFFHVAPLPDRVQKLQPEKTCGIAANRPQRRRKGGLISGVREIMMSKLEVDKTRRRREA